MQFGHIRSKVNVTDCPGRRVVRVPVPVGFTQIALPTAPLQLALPLFDLPCMNWYAVWSPFDMLSAPVGETELPLSNNVRDQL